MPDTDWGFKAALVVLAVLAGVFFYQMRHPSTTFAADGTDASWDAAVRHSQDAAKPTVVLFTAGWCPACRSLHGNVLSRGDVWEEVRNHYCFYTVDLTSPSHPVQAHARKCGVSSIPLMIRYDSNGKETDRTNYLEPAEMIAWLKAGE